MKHEKKGEFTLADAVKSVFGLNVNVAVTAAETSVFGESPSLCQLAPRIRLPQHQVNVFAYGLIIKSLN